ncbi:DegT/DnrJ/EryC1/StrS family aminotransferase [Isoptericola sp. G70]|uniref:DegT/DnrJ/EryC1/StrS family aminotransferase n=1 Tax=Isoptericola sp. G70 TaxID=3376633 RepID=UPI003A80F415
MRFEAPCWPEFGDREEETVLAAVRSGSWWRNEGSAVSGFEEAFGALEEVPYVIGVTNGTHALELALLASGVGADDKVLLPAMTFYSSLSAVQRHGATPVIADVDLSTWTLDVAAVRDAGLDHDLAGVVPVHYGGVPADLGAVARLAADRDLAVVQDAAHGPGIRPQGASLMGSGGTVGWSFQHSKLLPGGEGGAVGFGDETAYRRALALQNCGRVPGAAGYDHQEVASNFRMPELTGALLTAQLERFSDLAARRRQGAARLRARLAEVEGLELQRAASATDVESYYLVQARLVLPGAGAAARDRVVSDLVADGVPVSRTYPPLFTLPAYAGAPEKGTSLAELHERCPHSVLIGETGLSFHHRVLLAPADELDRLGDLVEAAVRAAEGVVTR